MDELEVRELRYFVAVAEELNFSRAAERLGVSQPPLSRAIRRMEGRLGLALFDRDTRRVALTPAGAVLLEEARGALQRVSAAVRRTRRAVDSTPVLLATAKAGLAAAMLRDIVAAYRGRPGGIDVEITVSGFRQQAAMVQDGRADVAVVGSPFRARGLDVEPLAEHPRVAALARNHPLARRDRLYCRDLAGEPFPVWEGTTGEEQRYWTGRDRVPAGGEHDAAAERPPGPAVADLVQTLEVVALGQAVALIPRPEAERHAHPDIALRPVADASPYTISIVWAEDSSSPHLARFVATATELAAARSAADEPAATPAR